MRRLRTIAAFATVLLGLSSCAVPIGSGEFRTESRPVSGFTVVDLGGSGEATVVQTGQESLTIEAPEKVLPLLTSEVVDGTLRLDVKPHLRLLNRDKVRYRITVKDLTGVTVRGSGSITIPKLATSTLRSEIDGSGSITVAGTAEDVQIAISGSGHHKGRDLESKTATVQVSGSGDADIAASESLRVNISGSGSVTYAGNPRVDQHISGSGKLVKA